jgi:DNA-binding response OmpR family regulator
VTGHASELDEAWARELGAVAYLQKPIDVAKLIDTIRAHLNISAAVEQET